MKAKERASRCQNQGQERSKRRSVRATVADGTHLDADRLVIRDSNGHVRLIAGVLEGSGEAYLAIADADGQIRTSLASSSEADPDGRAMLMFCGKS